MTENPAPSTPGNNTKASPASRSASGEEPRMAQRLSELRISVPKSARVQRCSHNLEHELCKPKIWSQCKPSVSKKRVYVNVVNCTELLKPCLLREPQSRAGIWGL